MCRRAAHGPMAFVPVAWHILSKKVQHPFQSRLAKSPSKALGSIDPTMGAAEEKSNLSLEEHFLFAKSL